MVEMVKVLWLDAWIDTEAFVTLDAVHAKHKPMPIETIGWLLVDDEKGVSVANERCLEDEGSYRGRTFIPRAMIVKVEPFKKVRRPRTQSLKQPSLESPLNDPQDKGHMTP